MQGENQKVIMDAADKQKNDTKKLDIQKKVPRSPNNLRVATVTSDAS